MAHVTQELEPCMRGSLVVVSGHGAQWTQAAVPGSHFTLPANFTLTVWQGPGMAMDDELGQFLDRGCTTTAFRRSSSQGRVVRTFDGNDLVPNLVLFPPGSLQLRNNQAGDAAYRVPPLAHANAVGAGGTFAANTHVAHNVNGAGVCNMVSLYRIMASARANALGRNFHWAACNSAPTPRARWLTADVDPGSSTNLLVEMRALFDIDSQTAGFPNP